MLGRNLHENQRDAVGIDDVHFMHSPWLLTSLAGDRHAAPRAVVIARQAAHRVPRRRLYVDRCGHRTVIRSWCPAPLSGVVIDGGRRSGRVGGDVVLSDLSDQGVADEDAALWATKSERWTYRRLPPVIRLSRKRRDIESLRTLCRSHRDRRRPLVDDPHSRPRWPHSRLVPGEIEYGDRQTVLIHRCGHGVSVTRYAHPSRRHAAGPEPAEFLSVFQDQGATSAMLWRDY